MDGTPGKQFEAALLAMDRVEARRILSDASREGSPYGAVESIVVPALEALGEGWNRGDVALSQVYMGGRICEEAVEAILPSPTPEAVPAPRSAIVVLDDFHMLGRRIVLSALRAAGFHVLDYGRLTVEQVVSRVVEDRVAILFVSVLMLPAALRVRELVSSLRQRQLAVRVVVGGAPFLFDAKLWREVGADAMGRTASDALRIAREFQGGPA